MLQSYKDEYKCQIVGKYSCICIRMNGCGCTIERLTSTDWLHHKYKQLLSKNGARVAHGNFTIILSLEKNKKYDELLS